MVTNILEEQAASWLHLFYFEGEGTQPYISHDETVKWVCDIALLKNTWTLQRQTVEKHYL